MAAQASASPLGHDFIFHNIGTDVPHRCLIRVLQNTGRHDVDFDIGDFHTDTALYRIRATVHGGRLGLPAIAITVDTKAMANSDPSQVTVYFEPGVAARGCPGKYNLESFKAGLLGMVGGGGHAYDHDPQVVGQAPLDDKRRLLKLQTLTYGFHSPSSVFAAIHNTPPNSDVRRLIQRLISADKLRLKIYFLVDNMPRQTYGSIVLDPLQVAVDLRLPPYHQYTAPADVLNMSLEGLQSFRRRMYCPRTQQPNGNFQFGRATILLPGVQGRDKPRPLAVVSSVGLIREKQAHNRFANDLASRAQSIRIVQTSDRLHNVNSRTLTGPFPRPHYEQLLLGYVSIDRRSSPVSASSPLPGTIFCFNIPSETENNQFPPTHATGLGIVLDAPAQCLAGLADFVLCLLLDIDYINPVRQMGVLSVHTDLQNVRLRPVSLHHMGNNRHTKDQLAGLHKFWDLGTLAGSTELRELQDKILDRMTLVVATPASRDLRARPAQGSANFTSYVNRMLNVTGMGFSTPAERACLQTLPQSVPAIQTILSNVGSHSFRAFALLMLALADAGHKVLIACDDAQDRGRVCNLIQSHIRNTINHLPDRAEDFRRRKALHYTTMEIETGDEAVPGVALSNTANAIRPGLELAFKYLCDDFPSIEYMLQQDAVYYQSADSYPPADQVPVTWSMGFAAQECLNDMFPNFPLRTQYLLARQRALDTGNRTPDDARRDLQARSVIVNEILSQTEILVTDYKTATTEAVKTNFTRRQGNAQPTEPIIVLLGTDKVRFDTAGALLATYEHWTCAFVVGDPADNRRAVPVGASQGNNEAWETFRRSFWSLVHVNGGQDFVLP